MKTNDTSLSNLVKERSFDLEKITNLNKRKVQRRFGELQGHPYPPRILEPH